MTNVQNMTSLEGVKRPNALDHAKTFIRFAKERGLDVRISDDKTRVELYSSSNGRKLCSSPVDDFSTERP